MKPVERHLVEKFVTCAWWPSRWHPVHGHRSIIVVTVTQRHHGLRGERWGGSRMKKKSCRDIVRKPCEERVESDGGHLTELLLSLRAFKLHQSRNLIQRRGASHRERMEAHAYWLRPRDCLTGSSQDVSQNNSSPKASCEHCLTSTGLVLFLLFFQQSSVYVFVCVPSDSACKYDAPVKSIALCTLFTWVSVWAILPFTLQAYNFYK